MVTLQTNLSRVSLTLYAVKISTNLISSLVAGAAVLVYDTFLVFDEEIDAVWIPLLNGSMFSTGSPHICTNGTRKVLRLLEAIMRYAMIATACMNIARTLGSLL